jgi:hypothetical protein
MGRRCSYGYAASTVNYLATPMLDLDDSPASYSLVSHLGALRGIGSLPRSRAGIS